MDKDTIRRSICEVIAEIQSISGLDCPELTGATKPARDVTDFKSEVWPIATAMLGAKLGIEIPDDENLFYDKIRSICSIDQCVEKVLQLTDAAKTKTEKKRDE